MPIFEFVCSSCASVFEKLVYDSSEAVACPQCGSSELKRLLSASSSLSGAKPDGRVPGIGDTGCCGSAPSSQGCVPGSCCGKANI
ncbi:MAG: zinc ribbon domain-containing protein [Syntrophobacteraceae bacterium]